MKKIVLGLLFAAFILPFMGKVSAQESAKSLLILPTVVENNLLPDGMVELFNKTITKAALEGAENYKVFAQDTTSLDCDFILTSKVSNLDGDFCYLLVEIENPISHVVTKSENIMFTPDMVSFVSACRKIAEKLFPPKNEEKQQGESQEQQGSEKSQEDADTHQENVLQSDIAPNETTVGKQNSLNGNNDTPDYIVLPEINLMVLRTEIGAMIPRDAAERQVKTSVGGFDDWRLPTSEELYLLYGYKDKFGKMKFQRYWASDAKKDNNGVFTEASYLSIDEAFGRAEMRKISKNVRSWQCGVLVVRNIN